MKNHNFEVALSFAGEDRLYVEKIASCLKKKKIKVFYDKYEEANIWGKNLYTHLDNVYQNEAKYCVMFISKYYAEKLWTNHERESAQARAFKENREYILPVKLDNTLIPGILGTIHYIDIKNSSTDQICLLIAKKLGQQIEIEEEPNEEEFQIPRVKRKITDLEKQKYVKESFKKIMSYFEKALKLLKTNNLHLETNLEHLSNSKFVAQVFVEGELKDICKIWISNNIFGTNSISYLQGTNRIDYDNDNSLNDYGTIADDGKDLFFQISAMGFGVNLENINPKKLTSEDLAKYFWKRFIQYLE